MCESSNPADPRSVEKEGQEVLQAPEQRFPCSPGEAAVPLQHMEVHSGAEIQVQPVEDPTKQQGLAQRRL